MTDHPDYSAWEWELGRPLLHFLLGLGGGPAPAVLGRPRRRALAVLTGLTESLLRKDPRLPVALAKLRGSSGLPVSWELRQVAGGSIPDPWGEDESELLVSRIALDVYPVLLSPPDLTLPAGYGRSLPAADPLIGLDHVVMSHPAVQDLSERLRRQTDGLDHHLLASPMGSAPLGQSFNPTQLLYAAARRWFHQSDATAEAFTGAAIACLRDTRSVMSNGSARIPAVVGLTGLPIEEGASLPVLGGRLRAPTPYEQGLDPFGSGRFSRFVADGVLETEVEFHLRPADAGISLTLPADAMERPSEKGRRLCLAALLAGRGWVPDRQGAPAVAWITELAPTGGASFHRPAPPFGPPSVRAEPLEAEKMASLLAASDAVAAADLTHVAICVDRLLRAVWEREPTESLIDAVIAWENLFGSRTETTFRVTSALAVLCEDNPSARISLQKELSKVYDARSRLIHGDLPEGDITTLRETAIQYGADALWLLITVRPDLLQLAKSNNRANRLLLDVPPGT